MIGLKIFFGSLLICSSAVSEELDIEDINKYAARENLVDMDMKLKEGKSVTDYFVDPDRAAYISNSNIQHAATTLLDRKWDLPIPYLLDSSISGSTEDAIMQAMTEYSQKTCITFTPKTTQEDYIVFMGDLPGCWSYLGRIGGGSQTLSLGSGCGTKRIAVHEIMHAIGFVHEQSRPDRDNHVNIHWENIEAGKDSQFRLALPGIHSSLGIDYDYESVMHYKRRAFSANGEDTITPKGITYDNSFEFGQKQNGGLSSKDVQQVNLLYGCQSDGSWGPWGSWSSCSEECGGGLRDRYRSCSGGKCFGLSKESLKCNEGDCDDDDGKWGCFPSDAFVRNDKGEQIEMKDLKIGEKVLTMDDNGHQVYSAITMMMHTDATRSGNDYVSMTTDDDEHHITMTVSHLISVSTKDYVFAKDVKPGQNITVFDASKNVFQSKQVKSVQHITKNGYYAPLSMEGTLVVNDVYVSCYAVFPSHSVSHFIFSFWRVLYANFETLLTHSMDEAGIHWYPSMLMNTATYLNILKRTSP